MDTAHQPTMAELRMRIAETRIRQHRVAAKLDISDGHLSNVLAEKKAVDAEMTRRIAEAIEEVAAEAVP